MKNKLSIVLLAGITLSTTSCATIFTGTKDSISFTSNPEGAKVFHKGIEKCVTPCTLEIQRSLSKQTVTFEKEGFASKEVKLTKNFNAVTLLNILFGGAIGVGIDAASGSLTKYSPKAYTAELEAK
ncbi:PEGA domain-containing protein [Chryseobacterium daecheongense]|uniref:PEGA domain-containing protein n=1 Tax=Chryseobacterium daecheongense TaxID=192389 RepID=A0A3N0W321_9FLAO|nr:PEGA domain-containing protein [Chryseobacterium daecheongense]ROH99461.1 PEGA domain-containing protein [Chryseobacterium daecheongense]TDX95638.1 PEGA domain-containing protein [Chryseobacterium daecheongense]